MSDTRKLSTMTPGALAILSDIDDVLSNPEGWGWESSPALVDMRAAGLPMSVILSDTVGPKSNGWDTGKRLSDATECNTAIL